MIRSGTAAFADNGSLEDLAQDVREPVSASMPTMQPTFTSSSSVARSAGQSRPPCGSSPSTSAAPDGLEDVGPRLPAEWMGDVAAPVRNVD